MTDDPYAVATFEEFWPSYLRMHSRRSTRIAHTVATLTATALLILAIAFRQPLLALAAPLADHLIAQASHRVAEKNRTRPWRHVPWHLRAELKLALMVLGGRA